MPSKLEFYAFPRLKSAKKEMDNNHMDYKSGATFSGQLDGRKREGHGVFVWPNGDRYKGEYVDNDRHGAGEQIWSDGSKFSGDFVRDTRHGQGEHIWQDGEVRCFILIFAERKTGNNNFFFFLHINEPFLGEKNAFNIARSILDFVMQFLLVD